MISHEGADGSWHIASSRGFVEGVSRRRLPFEPRGPMREFREALRSELRAIKPVDGLGFVARYGAPEDGFVDVENVLLYNVGAGSYSHLVGPGLAVFRTTSPDDRHHMRYSLESIGNIAFDGVVLAEVHAPLSSMPHTPGEWWSLLHSRIESSTLGYPSAFKVDVVLDGAHTGPRLAGLVKPMLDGLISALHTHDGSHRDVLATRLGTLGDSSEVWTALCDRSRAVLGAPRCLLRPHGSGIAWNPADDSCIAFRVAPGRSARPHIYARIIAGSS